MYLRPARHPVKIKSFLIDHRFRDEVLLFSFQKKTSIIDDSHIDKRFDLFRRELLLRKRLLILDVMSSPLITRIFTNLLILIADIHR